MKRWFFGTLLAVFVVGCSIEEEISAPASSDDTSDRTTVSVLRDVSLYDDNDAHLYWQYIGFTPEGNPVVGRAQQSWETYPPTRLPQSPSLKVGKFFTVAVTANNTGDERHWAPDFLTDGRYDPTCRITSEIVAQNAAGEVISDAVANFNAHFTSNEFYPTSNIGQSAFSVSAEGGYSVSLYGFFTDSALRNNVKKLIVKSGSECGQGYNKRVISAVEVAQIPVTITTRNDDLTVVANLEGQYGDLSLDFSRSFWSNERGETERPHLAVMLVDDQGLQRGYYSSEDGVAKAYEQDSHQPQRGRTSLGDFFNYTVYSFGWWTLGSQRWPVAPLNCAEGWRVLALLQDLHRVERYEEIWVTKKGTTRIYEGLCGGGG